MAEKMQYMRAVIAIGGERKDGPSRKELLEDTSLAVPFVASTEGVKADGLNLKMDDWDLSRFKRYGPILWLHNYWRPPIGTGRATIDDKLFIDVHFDEEDEFAMDIRRKAIKGMMAGSVGWATIEGKGQKVRNQLMEFSMTPMGLDPDALPAIGRMTESLRHNMTRALANVDEELSMHEALEEIRKEIAKGLQEVLDEFIDEDARQEAGETEELDDVRSEEIDNDDETEERDLEEEPETGGSEAGRIESEIKFVPDQPMFWDGQNMHIMTTTTANDEAEMTTSGTVRLITDEGEDGESVLQRAGAVLSKKNRDDLQAARDLIAAVIDRATPDDDEMLLSLQEDDERNAEPAEAADDGLDGENTLANRDEDEGLAPNIVQQIEQLLAE